MGAPLVCDIKSKEYIVGLLQSGPEKKLKTGHNYFINVLIFNKWIHHYIGWPDEIQYDVS